MKRHFLYIFLLFFIVGFLILPNIAFAELNPEEIIKNQDEIEFKKKDMKAIFKTLVQELDDEWIETTSSSHFKIEEQVILTILVKEIKVDALQYLLIESSKDLIEVTLKLVGLLLAQDPGFIIEEIEKITVNEAKEYAMEWLLQKEIKVAKGNLKFSYPAYSEGWEQGVFPYIIVYRPLDLKSGEVAIEIYSSRTIKTPDLIAGYQWEGGIDELPPFIVRVKGRVEKFDWVSYRWTKGPEIDIIFDEPVPDFEFKEPTVWDKFKSFVNKLEVISNNVIDLGVGRFQEIVEKIEDIYNTTVSFFSDLNLFGASVTPAPQFFEEEIEELEYNEEVNQEWIERELERIGKIWTKTEASSEINEIDIDKFQDMLDDIAERIDILSQEVKELLAEEAFDGVGGPIEGLELEKGEGEQEEPASAPDVATAGEEQEEKQTSRSSGGGGGSPPPPPPSYPKVLISEIQIKGEEDEKEEFIELYNPNESDINLTNWYVQRKTKSGSDYSSFASKTLFSGKIIKAKDYFLIARQDSSFVNLADIITDYPLTKDNTLVLKNPNREIVDKVGWGQAQDYETAPSENPLAGQSIGRKWINGTYQDNDNNQDDFEAQKPTPKAENSQLEEEPEPEPEPGEQEEEEEPGPESESEESSQIIVINEIAWMGTKASSYDEWIELYNPNSEPVELLDWQLIFQPLDSDKPRITSFSILETTTPSIDAFSYFLLERTDDTTVNDIEADYIFKGALNDDGGMLELRDSNFNLIDKVDCPDNWFAGNKDNKISMERINDDWASNNLIIRQGKDADDNKIWGTPKAENSIKPLTEIFQPLPFDEFDEITLGIQSSPYIIRWTLDIPQGKTLNIEPGVVLKFYDHHSGITVSGTLKAIGSENNEIIFTCLKDDSYPGCWGGIYFTETSIDSELNNIVVEYAGGDSWNNRVGVQVEESSVIIKDSLFEHNMYNGVRLINSDSLVDNVQFIENATYCAECHNVSVSIGVLISGGSPIVKNSLFKKNGYGIRIYENSTASIENNIFEENEKAVLLSNASPVFINNQANDNDIDGVFVSGNITQDTDWQADLPYIIFMNINIFPDITLTLEPGVIVKLYDKYGKITVDGSLKAIGTEDNKIIFTSFKDEPQPGDWDQIYFSPSSFDSELVNVIIRYGGGRYIVMAPCPWEATAIKVYQSSILLKDSIIEHNKHQGLWLIDSGSIIDNVQFLENPPCQSDRYTYGGIGLTIEQASPTVKNSVFKKHICGILIKNSEPILDNLIFEANTCNIFQNNECINPVPAP